MVRPKISRTIRRIPDVTFFKPRGIPLKDLEEVNLSVEEIESLRLKHYKGLNQNNCASHMEISQSTFSRILESAHKKITIALIEGKSIKIIIGNFDVNKSFLGYGCLKCNEEWEVNKNIFIMEKNLTQEKINTFLPLPPDEEIECPKCNSNKIYRLTKNILTY